ncbi:MAG: BatD family protein [Dysgonamonadaceae bacterium]|jgi:hypothetical protein|nr:BatD family protein [Dysgonamonadaceae bacterium]
MRKRLVLFVLYCLSASYAFTQSVSFEMTAPRTVVVNQQFRLNLTLETSGSNGRNVQLPQITDIEQLYGPVLSSYYESTQIINGKSTNSRTEVYTFTLLPKKEGKFTIPKATVQVGNSEYKSNELSITVLPPDKADQAASANQDQGQQAAQSSGQTSSSGLRDDNVFIRTIVGKTSVYENEAIPVSFKLYFNLGISSLSNAKFPDYEGFTASELETSDQADMENYNGRNYKTVTIKRMILYPQRSGSLTITSGKLDAVIQVPTPQRSRSFFDFDIMGYSEVKKTLVSPQVTINVKPLPPGKPASFVNSSVGDFKLTSTISKTNMKSDEAVTIKVAVSGAGNLKLIKVPEIVFPNDFEVLDPTVNTNIAASGASGSKTVEYNAIPRYPGDYTIPAAEFSYFNPSTGKYYTLKTEEYKLHVEQGSGSGTSTAAITSGTNKEEIRFLGKDIRYIKTEGYNFKNGKIFFGTLSYWLFYIIPALLFAVLFIIYRKQAAENANIALVRTKKANKVASKRLKTADKLLKDNKKDAFYEEILRAVWGYLSDKLNIPVAELTKDNVEANLVQYGVEDELVGDFRDILDTAEFARFAPAESGGGMSELYDRTVQAIDRMESKIKKQGGKE